MTTTYEIASFHSIERAKERIGYNKRNAEKQIERAIARGKTADHFTSWERDYLQGECGESRESPYTEYTDGDVANFSCDFILPKTDSQVTEIIRLWNAARIYRGMLHSELVKRVEAVGGMMIIWY